MPVEGVAELDRKMKKLQAEGRKLGKKDGKKDRGKFLPAPEERPHFQYLRDRCETVKVDFLSFLDKLKASCEAEIGRLEHAASTGADEIRDRESRISLMEGEQRETHDPEKARLIGIRVSQEKTQLEATRSKLAGIKASRVRAGHQRDQADRERIEGEVHYQEREDDVMETYNAAYVKSQTKQGVLRRAASR